MVEEAARALRKQNEETVSTPLSIADVIVATFLCLGIAGAGAVVGWVVLPGVPFLYLGLLIGALALGIWAARRSPVGPGLALGYSLALGTIAGAFSHSATAGGGNMALIAQALTGTVAGAVGMLLLYSTPWGRKASRAVRLFTGVAIGYVLLSLTRLVASLFGVGGGWGFYGVGPLGLLLCAAGVALACWSLLIDFGAVDTAVRTQAGEHWKWSLGMSLAGALIWMYIEILRLLSIANR